MQRYTTLLVLILAAAGITYPARTQTTEQRLSQYGCSLHLPGPDFIWLTQEDIPGATLACRDSNDRFIILVVAKAPAGYRIDARQGAGFEKGMAKHRDIERLDGGLTNFLGLTCYEIRGHIKTAQSLTLSRYFTTNGFLYNLQAMIPEPSPGKTVNFDELFAAFSFTERAENLGAAPAEMNSPDDVTALPGVPPRHTGNDENAVPPPPKVQAAAESPSEAQAQASPDAPAPTTALSSNIPWFIVLAAGGLLGAIASVILLRMPPNRRRVL